MDLYKDLVLVEELYNSIRRRYLDIEIQLDSQEFDNVASREGSFETQMNYEKKYRLGDKTDIVSNFLKTVASMEDMIVKYEVSIL